MKKSMCPIFFRNIKKEFFYLQFYTFKNRIRTTKKCSGKMLCNFYIQS